MNQPSNYTKLLLHTLQKDSWGLRIILDVYALCLDVPLRIYSVEEAGKFWDYASHLDPDFKERFPSRPDFDEYVRNLMAKPIAESIKAIVAEEECSDNPSIFFKLRNEQGDYWYTYRSNTNPMLQMMFSEHRCWRRWDFYWLYHQFILKEIPSTDETLLVKTKPINWGFDEHMHLSYTWIPELESFMVAGPVWQLADKNAGQSFEENKVKPFVEKFVEIVKTENPEYLSHHKDRLIRLGNSRFPIGEKNLNDRLQQASSAFRALLTLTVPGEETEYHRSDYIKLAEWSLFSIKVVDMMQGYYPYLSGKKDCSSQLELYYHVEHLSADREQFWIETCLNCGTGNQLPQLQLLLTAPSEGEQIKAKGIDNCIAFKSTETEGSAVEKWSCPVRPLERERLLERMDTSLSRFLAESLAKQNASKCEYLSILRNWLNDRFGTLREFNNAELNNLAKLENQLSAHIVGFLHADIATLYRYDYNREKLVTLGLYYNGRNERLLWRDKEPPYMEQAGQRSDLRTQSICYRCIDTREIRFCRAFNSNTGEADPPQEVLLNPPDGLHSHQSGIAVPISVHGRPWGVLEVLGNRPHQFRWDDRRFMGELSEILSPFFYYQWFLDKLHEMNTIAVNKKATQPPGYDEICHCLAEMLLSYGAGLWVREGSHDYYICKGRYNRPWEDKLKNEKIKPGDKSAVTAALTERQKESWPGWWEGEIGKSPYLDKEWERLARNADMGKQGIQTLCSIPVYVPTEDNVVLAVIVLYNKTTAKYDKRWKHLFTLVARYTALVLEAMRAQSDYEKRSRAFINHEMKTHIEILLDRAQSIARFLHSPHTSWGTEQNQRYELWIKDLTVHAHYLKDTLTLLKKENFGKYLTSISPVVEAANDKRLIERTEWLDLRTEFNQTFRAEYLIQKKRGLSVEYHDLQNCSPHIFIHKQNLNHIISNLCENAVKYAAEGSTIRAEVLKTPYAVELNISNVGDCLAEGEENRIFENRFRGKNANTKPGEGIGLFIVRGICELYNIQISYDSQPYQDGRYRGCKHIFTLSFPLTMVKTY